MKVRENVTVFMGGVEADFAAGKKGDMSKKQKTVFAGNLNVQTDPIEQKRKEAQKKALRVVKEAFEGDRSVDNDLDNRRKHMGELQDKILEAREEIKKCQEQCDQLDTFSDKEMAKAAKETLAEAIAEYEEDIKDAKKESDKEVAIIKGIKQERLKSNPMTDAQKQADEIMKNASDEIMGMLAKEGTDHLDEVRREQDEKKEALEEQQEKIDEFIEKQREKRREEEELDLPTEEMLRLGKIQEEVKAEVEKIVDKMNLVALDIAGAMVDEKV